LATFVVAEKKLRSLSCFFARPKRLPKEKEDKRGKVGSDDAEDAVEDDAVLLSK
jgi:hypothetical protein